MAMVQPKTRAVRVLRPFTLNGETTKVGAQLALPNAFACEMVSAGKATFDITPTPAAKPTKVTRAAVQESPLQATEK